MDNNDTARWHKAPNTRALHEYSEDVQVAYGCYVFHLMHGTEERGSAAMVRAMGNALQRWEGTLEDGAMVGAGIYGLAIATSATSSAVYTRLCRYHGVKPEADVHPESMADAADIAGYLDYVTALRARVDPYGDNPPGNDNEW